MEMLCSVRGTLANFHALSFSLALSLPCSSQPLRCVHACIRQQTCVCWRLCVGVRNKQPGSLPVFAVFDLAHLAFKREHKLLGAKYLIVLVFFWTSSLFISSDSSVVALMCWKMDHLYFCHFLSLCCYFWRAMFPHWWHQSPWFVDVWCVRLLHKAAARGMPPSKDKLIIHKKKKHTHTQTKK